MAEEISSAIEPLKNRARFQTYSAIDSFENRARLKRAVNDQSSDLLQPKSLSKIGLIVRVSFAIEPFRRRALFEKRPSNSGPI